MVCCSIRALTFYFSSLHIFFAVTQLALVLPMASSTMNERTYMTLSSVMLGLLLFVSGFLIFRGADEESKTLIRVGGCILLLNLSIRYALVFGDLMDMDGQPELIYISVEGFIPQLSVTGAHYLVYLAILLVYQRDLKSKSRKAHHAPDPYKIHSQATSGPQLTFNDPHH